MLTNKTATIKKPTYGTRNAYNQPTVTYTDEPDLAVWFTHAGNASVKMLEGQKYDYEMTIWSDYALTTDYKVTVDGIIYSVVWIKKGDTPFGAFSTICGLVTFKG